LAVYCYVQKSYENILFAAQCQILPYSISTLKKEAIGRSETLVTTPVQYHTAPQPRGSQQTVLKSRLDKQYGPVPYAIRQGAMKRPWGSGVSSSKKPCSFLIIRETINFSIKTYILHRWVSYIKIRVILHYCGTRQASLRKITKHLIQSTDSRLWDQDSNRVLRNTSRTRCCCHTLKYTRAVLSVRRYRTDSQTQGELRIGVISFSFYPLSRARHCL
jgi:hypothetical protein